MVTMKGKRTPTRLGYEYRTWEDRGRKHNGFRLCNICCLALTGGTYHTYDQVPLTTWGYVGKGPDLTSAGLIGLAIAETIPLEEWHYGILYGAKYIKNEVLDVCGLSWCFAHGSVIKNIGSMTGLVTPYYKSFTKEHTSKWGDEWTMTSDEVMAWLISKGYKQKEKVVA